MENSRTSLSGAGWECAGGEVKVPTRPGTKLSRLSWKAPGTLFKARNEILVRLRGRNATNAQRQKWLAGQPQDFSITPARRSPESVSLIVLGDPGEGDFSQYAVIKPLLAVGADTDFMVMASDVIYPAGDINDYPSKFYQPYRDYERPIYAVPGNHDWDDGALVGFMYHFCERDPAAARQVDSLLPWPRAIWHPLRRRSPTAATVAAREQRRQIAPVVQAAPYFCIDAGPITIVGIDTGLGQEPLDRQQAAWLRQVSASPTPKILITGKPLIVNGEYHPNPIEDGGTIDDIVRDPANNYIAAIGGDVHNYQRYVVATSTESWMPYLVSGGGGAFMSGTHDLGVVNLANNDPHLPPIGEDDFRCYPRRGDSLATFSYLYAARLPNVGFTLAAIVGALGLVAIGKTHKPLAIGLEAIAAGLAASSLTVRLRPDMFRLPPPVAERYISRRTGLHPVRSGAADAPEPSSLQRWWAKLTLLWPQGKASRQAYSPLWDWDQPPPPLFKSFLRIDANAESVSIRAFAATGCADHQRNPPLEDHLRWTVAGGWTIEPGD